MSNFITNKLLDDPEKIDANFQGYLNGFSENVQDIITKFKFLNRSQHLKIMTPHFAH